MKGKLHQSGLITAADFILMSCVTSCLLIRTVIRAKKRINNGRVVSVRLSGVSLALICLSGSFEQLISKLFEKQRIMAKIFSD